MFLLFGLKGNLDFPDFLQKKFYNINYRKSFITSTTGKDFLPKVAFTLRQITRRKMVICLLKKTFFIVQMAQSMAYYALSESAFSSV